MLVINRQKGEKIYLTYKGKRISTITILGNANPSYYGFALGFDALNDLQIDRSERFDNCSSDKQIDNAINGNK